MDYDGYSHGDGDNFVAVYAVGEHHDIPYVARAAVPMFFLMCLAVALLIAFPGIATLLPETMAQASAR